MFSTNSSRLSFSWTSSGFFYVELSSTLAKLQHAKDSHSELCFFCKCKDTCAAYVHLHAQT